MSTIVNQQKLPVVTAQAQQGAARQDVRALWIGILFSALFTGLIWWLGDRLQSIPHLPDSGASWYYWRLPQQESMARITAWGFYLLHQGAIWGLIFAAQRAKSRYTTGLHWFNYAALGVNVLFSFVHLLQTHVWYDALAQDVSIWSSQWSVILLLVVVLLMENPRRGLVMGAKAPLSKRAVDFARKYHGYLFAWATIYTFWYHPMENTTGHLVGFFYMFLLMLQGSLFFTRIHQNRYWTFTQEFTVLVHGTMVAVMQGNGMWPMFGFGFAGIVVLTQLHGLGLPTWVRWSTLGVYLAAALWVYSDRGIAKIHQITWIPFTEYAVVFVVAGLISLGLWLYDRTSRRNFSETVGQ